MQKISAEPSQTYSVNSQLEFDVVVVTDIYAAAAAEMSNEGLRCHRCAGLMKFLA